MTTTTVTLIPGENCCPFCLAEKAGSNPYGWLYFDCGTQYRPVLDDANRSVQCYERQLADTSHENALLTKVLKFVQDGQGRAHLDTNKRICPQCGAHLDACWFCGEPGPPVTVDRGPVHKHIYQCGGSMLKNPSSAGSMSMGIGCYQRLLYEARLDCVVLRQALFYMAGRVLDARGTGPSKYSTFGNYKRAVHRLIKWITLDSLKDVRFRSRIEAETGWRFREAKAQVEKERSSK